MQSVPAVGDILSDRYYIEEILSVGNQTATMKCFDTRLDVSGVIKMLLGDEREPDWEARRAQFVSSFRVQARLNHPNIVHVSNIELRHGNVYAVMEYLEGMLLDRYLREAEISAKEVIELFLGIVDAVSMAHAGGMVHNEISPHNIMLNPQGKRLSPRLLNFSIQRDVTSLSPTDSLPFLAPEQFDPRFKATPVSDVYALCATIYYAFVHRPPVQFDSFCDYQMYYAMHDGIEEMSDFIPEDFVPLLQKGLRTNPDERYEDAGGVLKVLKQLGEAYKLSANLTIEASKSHPQMAAMTPSNPVTVVRSSTGSYSQKAMTPSKPVTVVRSSTGSYSQNAMTPSKPVTVIRSSTGSYPQNAMTPSKPVTVVRSSTGSYPQNAMTPSKPIVISDVVESGYPQSDSGVVQAIAVSSRQPSGAIAAPSSQIAVNPPLSSSVSQSILISDVQASVSQKPTFGVDLPQELASTYFLQRVDNISERGFLGAVASFESPDVLFGIKCFFARSEIEAAVFNEGVRRAEILSDNNPFFEGILTRYPESCAFLYTDTSRDSLAGFMRKNGVISIDVALHIAILIAQAMEVAQQSGFVNGNLKPNNILFENQSGVLTPVIFDFGQRLYLNSIDRFDIDEIPFIAPDLGYNLQNANAQTDIYAFGMCLYFMLLGALPYEAQTNNGLVAEILSYEGVPDIRTWRSDVPAELVQLIQWCTAFDPTKRYVRFSDLLRDLYIVYHQIVPGNAK